MANNYDDFFDAVEDSLGNACDKYGKVGKELIQAMRCASCGGEIRCSCESWGADHITFDELRCKECCKTYGVTGFRQFRLDKTEVRGFEWLFSYILSLFIW